MAVIEIEVRVSDNVIKVFTGHAFICWVAMETLPPPQWGVSYCCQYAYLQSMLVKNSQHPEM